MPLHNPIHTEVTIKPIFVKEDGTEYPFYGVCPEDEGIVKDEEDYEETDEYGYEEIDYRYNETEFIEYVLNKYLGLVSFNNYYNEIIKGELELTVISHSQKKILEDIYEFTGDYPIKHRHSYLKFIIINGESECYCNACSPDDDDHSWDRDCDCGWDDYD